MFEGLVSQVLAGYLGRYIKGIQKDQLKIGLWSEEVKLENVELILEAFDYLQLPFGLKNGRVGKLSLKIPWKKLGWDPIIVVLEDVFVCACQRDDCEWSSELVERRELAGKMAKLNAVELAKFSNRVSDNQTGQSFISYISAKILDNIQVSIRNVHMVYIDAHRDLEKYVFGLRFSSLTFMTDTRKHNTSMSSFVKSRGGQVNKVIEMSTLGFYCNMFDDTDNAQPYCDLTLGYGGYDYLIHPFDISLSLLVNKLGKLDGAPQYAINAELNVLVVSFTENQVQQILSLWDYFSICALREKYGRYRPPHNSLSRKVVGWQRMWWHYAQECVLADVRQKMRKSSWSNLGKRLSSRRKYVNLYKRKLELLQRDQIVDKDILHELEKMDKECDIEDILSYRSTAEQQLQELLFETSIIGSEVPILAEEKKLNDGQTSGSARGWLNWLSLGMLGAGGTADSNSFAGVVSDDIIKDIYEATEFHPVPSSHGDSLSRNGFCLLSLKFSIHQIITSVSSKRCGRKLAEALFGGISTECRFWDDSAALLLWINSAQITNPSNKNMLLVSMKATVEDTLSADGVPFMTIQIKLPRLDESLERSVKIMLQPFEATYDSDFVLGALRFYHFLAPIEFQHNRVLLSLNGLEDFRTRLRSKAEYLLHNSRSLIWDITVHNIVVKLPLKTKDTVNTVLVWQLGKFNLKSRPKVESDSLMLNKRCFHDSLSTICIADFTESLPMKYHDLYDDFEIQLTGFEVTILKPGVPGFTSVVDKFDSSIDFRLCLVMDEPILKQLEVDFIVLSLGMHFSPEIFLALIVVHDMWSGVTSEAVEESVLDRSKNYKPRNASSSQFSCTVKLEHFCFLLHLDEACKSTLISSALESIDIRFSSQEYFKTWFFVKALKVDALNLNGESGSHTLCSSSSSSVSKNQQVFDEYGGVSSMRASCSDGSSNEACFQLHYQVSQDNFIFEHDCSMLLSDIDLHIYPSMFGLLQKFYNRLSGCGLSSVKRTSGPRQKCAGNKMASIQVSRFGSSNFHNTESNMFIGIPVDSFPFVTISNSGFLGSLDGQSVLPPSGLKLMDIHDRQCPNQKLKVGKKTLDINLVGKKPSSGMFTSSDYVNIFTLELDLTGIRAHFHDSSCILATVTVPAAKSFLSFKEDESWDMLFSIEGLVLSSSWSAPSIREFLWGPVSSSIPPIVNVRVRQGTWESLHLVTEICIGIQHVCCILPPDFLAVVIGYFSLPDWTCGKIDQHENGDDKFVAFQNTQFELLYKFEILSSVLILPSESLSNHFLQLGLPQLYCSFIPTSSNLADTGRDIPSDCMIPVSTTADKIDVLNVFGRLVSLSLLPFRDEETTLLKLVEDNVNVPLISHLDADLWIRIPSETRDSTEQSAIPSLIMMRADICTLNAEDAYFLLGLAAVVDVVDRFLSVGGEAKLFKSDILHFLQLKRKLNDSDKGGKAEKNSILSIKVCAKALSIKFSRLSSKDSASTNLVAKAEMQLNFSMLVRNEIPQLVDVEIPSLVLYSFYSSVMLASVIPDVPFSSNFCIKFSKSDLGKTEIKLLVPCLDIWLHLSDWNEVVNIFCAYGEHAGRALFTASNNSSAVSGTQNVLEDQISNSTAEVDMQDAANMTCKFELVSVAFYLPVWDDEENFANKSATTEKGRVSSNDQSWQSLAESEKLFKQRKSVKLTLQSKYFELTLGERHVKINCNMEKLQVLLEKYQNDETSSLPFIQISRLKLETELYKRQGVKVYVFVEVQLESVDIRFSYQIVNFWSHTRLKFPEPSSQVPCHDMVIKVYLKKLSLLLTDGRWSPRGPILESLIRNVLVEFKQNEDFVDGSASADLLVNYNNIDKVAWEPFLEPWSFHVIFVRKHAKNVVLAMPRATDIYLKSTKQLNLNVTEPLFEVIFRADQIIKNALSQHGPERHNEDQEQLGYQTADNIRTRQYAPYILCNDTSLPLSFHVFRCAGNGDDMHIHSMEAKNYVRPGFSFPIYVEETSDDQFFQDRAVYSSERLVDKKRGNAAHHMISIQFDGTSEPSKPMSMDLVGLSYFEVNFSNYMSTMNKDSKGNVASGYNTKNVEKYTCCKDTGLVVPVVFEVSIHHYSKRIRLYSTVILFNATSMPLEIRFDIPLGVSPKILDPILPGQDFPLPLHLAEAGQLRWRPAGSNYLWSEAHSLSNILSQESRLGFLRSFVCYPSHPSSDPFRCCISVQDYSLSSSGGARKPSLRRTQSSDLRKDCFIRQVRLTTPLLVKNYLPVGLSLTIDSGGCMHSMSIPEGDTTSVYLFDFAHDLGITFDVQEFRSATSKFPRADSFIGIAMLKGSKFSSSETLAFSRDASSDPLLVSIEKVMDAHCGAREMCLYVPFLLYNCMGLSLTIMDSDPGRNKNCHVLPPSYHLTAHEHVPVGKHSLSLLSDKSESIHSSLNVGSCMNSFSTDKAIFLRERVEPHLKLVPSRHFAAATHYTNYLNTTGSSYHSPKGKGSESNPLNLSGKVASWDEPRKVDSRMVKAFMYAPPGHNSAMNVMVSLSASLPQCRTEKPRNQHWSSPFPLVPPSGSMNVSIPQPRAGGAFLVSIASISVTGELSGRTRAITFQPRYVICNACTRDLCYKQKGTNNFYHLRVGQHAHLHCSDRTRELLVSIRFNEPGWQWSGSFLPDYLGDALVKMRNVSGALNMVRVEVQNADLVVSSDRIIRSSNGNSMTQLILLSDDKTGFMPYRIDNFSMEKLRIYQQKCESFETIVHSYTSCQYAWDEPCYPHRLVIDVPGERILGTYSLDDVREYAAVCLPSTSEKPERRLYISLHAERAIKVLCIIDSNYHIVDGMKETHFLDVKDNKGISREDYHADFDETITLHLPFIGVSLINSSPQEIVFACAKETTVVLQQNLDEQNISFQIMSLQIDNQLPETPYPIMLSFGSEQIKRAISTQKNKEDISKIHKENWDPASGSKLESSFRLMATKWRKSDSSLVSFKYINLWLAPICIEIEEQILLGMFDLFRAVSSRLQSRKGLQKKDEQRTQDYVGKDCSQTAKDYKCKQYSFSGVSERFEAQNLSAPLPSVVPIGAPWQQIYLLARRQKKIYVEVLELAPIEFSISFSSSPWMVRNEVPAEVEPLTRISSTTFQRGLMALIDVEGVPIHFKQLNLDHLMASRESIQEILARHYTRQLLHELYKVFGSAGVIGNPMGFARNVGAGIRDFVSVSSKEIMQSPIGLFAGIAQGSKSLLGSTVYAISSATTQFSKAAHKGIVAFTFDERAAAERNDQHNALDPRSKGIVNEFLEGLTGLLQSPIKGAEKHGLPGVISGIAMGTAGLVGRPMASILETTGKAAQSIRNRSSPHQSNRYRIRFPRPLARELPLCPYSWEEAIGVSILLQVDGARLKDERFVMCKELKQEGKFVVVSENLILDVSCPQLVGFRSPEFLGVAVDPGWCLETEMSLESIVHLDRTEDIVNVIGSNGTLRHIKLGLKNRSWSPQMSTLSQMSMEFPGKEEAEDVLQVLLSNIEHGRERRWGARLLNRNNLR